MAARSFQIALGAGATRLSDVYIGATGPGSGGPNTPIGGSAGNPDARSDIAYRQIVFFASGAIAYIGSNQDMAGTSTTPVSSTTFGTKVDITAGIPPLIIGAYETGPMKLSDFWASGTGATLHILATPF